MGLRWSKTEKKLKKMGGPGGACVAIPGGMRREIFFDFFAFQNRAQGSRVGHGDNFPPPPPGGTPLVRAGGVQQSQNFRN